MPDLTTARAFLSAAGFGDTADADWTPLTGGISSDLWRVDTRSGPVCVKAALPRLRVADEWSAPLDRNAVECGYLRWAGDVRPGSVPRVLAHDAGVGLFVMEFLPPYDHPTWKSRLMAGDVDVTVAREVGVLVGALHAASAGDDACRERFATDENFEQLRLTPYLRVTAERHPDHADRLLGLAARTAGIHEVVVHGDVSPKNILTGPAGPVLLDAECAWYGDPAFDVAFCLNHLVLKAAAGRPAEALAASAAALWHAYRAAIGWTSPDAVATRATDLLPALLLARVDGRSPVEYLDTDQRDRVRALARGALADNVGPQDPAEWTAQAIASLAVPGAARENVVEPPEPIAAQGRGSATLSEA